MMLPPETNQTKPKTKHKPNPNAYIWPWSQNANFHGCQSSLLHFQLCPCFLTIYFLKAGNKAERCLQYFMGLIFVNQAQTVRGKIIHSYKCEEFVIQPSLRWGWGVEVCCFFNFVLFSWGIVSLTFIGITARALRIAWLESLFVWTLYFSLLISPHYS